MKYETVTQAYNAMKGMSANTLEARAQAINADIAANANADIQAYNVELEAIERIIEEKRDEAKPAGYTTPEDLSRTAQATGKDVDPAGTKQYRSAFFKTMQGARLTADELAAYKAVNETRAAAFNTLSDSAAVIPTTTLDNILVKARDKGGIMGIARAFNMPANIAIPVATPGQAAQWHTEGAQVDSEKVTPATVTFGAYEIMRILSISAATRTMSISAFEGYLVDELAASVAATLARGMVDGTGSQQATGILTGITWGDENSVTVAANKSLTYDDVLAAIAKLHRGYAQGARFVMNNATLYQDVYGITDQVNRPIYVNDPTQGGKGRVMGFDVEIDDYMPDHAIIFGNFGYYGYNLPSGLALDMSRDSSFTRGLIDYRALAIADAKPIVGEAFVKIAKAE